MTAFLLIAIANFPFWLFTSGYFLLRPLFNVDIILALMAAVMNPLLLVPSIIIVWVVDAIQSLSLAYHFQSPADFFMAANYIQHLDVSYFFSIQVFGILAVFAFSGLSIFVIYRRSGLKIFPLFLIAGSLIVIDVFNGSGLPVFLNRMRTPLSLNVNVQGSPLFNLVSSIAYARELANHPLIDLPVDSRLVSNIIHWVQKNPRGSVLVVLVESWGVQLDPELRAWSTKSLMAEELTQRYNIQSFTIPFRGSTTAGELRTLCELDGHYSRLHATKVAGCLPHRIAEAGFDSVGLHGFSGRMFERYSWWPMIGFNQSVFAEDFPSSAPRCGGAFKGICDDFLLKYAFDLLKPGRFVYALTLNTHLPLKPMILSTDLIKLCKVRRVTESVCQMTGQIGRLFDQLAVLTKSEPGPMLMVVAGDHSPPFLNDKDRFAFSKSDVPVIIFKTQ